MIRKYMTLEEVEAFNTLTRLAKKIEEAQSDLLQESLKADIPDDARHAILKELLPQGALSYVLTPQPEWTGGDSGCDDSYRMVWPHILERQFWPEDEGDLI